MTRVYVMESCPDCTYVEQQIAGDDRFEIVDIGSHVRRLKEFLHLRDTNAAIDGIRRLGYVGIPCFVREDGSVTLRPEEVGLHSRPKDGAPACSIDGKGC